MEYKKRTELTRKMGTDSEIESRLTALGGGIEQKRNRTHGQGQQCGDCEGREGGVGGRG